MRSFYFFNSIKKNFFNFRTIVYKVLRIFKIYLLLKISLLRNVRKIDFKINFKVNFKISRILTLF